MNKYEIKVKTFKELKSLKIKTVGALIEELKKYDTSTLLVARDGDHPGYYVSEQEHVIVRPSERKDIIFLGHLETVAGEMLEEKNITQKEHDELLEIIPEQEVLKNEDPQI